MMIRERGRENEEESRRNILAKGENDDKREGEKM